MKVKRDQITGLILIIMGAAIAAMTGKLDAEMTITYPGAKFLPYISAFGLIICGLGIAVEGTFSKKEDVIWMDLTGLKKAALAFATLVGYIILMNYLGFLIATPVMLFITSTLFAGKANSKLVSRIVYSVLATFVVYIIYAKFFGVRLPQIHLF